MSAQITVEDARKSMLARAIQWMLIAVYEDDAKRFEFAKGYACALEELANPEGMRRSIEFDLSNGFYSPASGLEAAHAALSTGFKHASMADVQKMFPASGVWSLTEDHVIQQ